MKKINNNVGVINSVSDLHRLFGLPKPLHPLISLMHHTKVRTLVDSNVSSVVSNIYIISNKKDFKGKMKYGKNYYDFDEGTMVFVSPGQVMSVEGDDTRDCSGWSLIFHPDLIRNYPLGSRIKTYGFFSYDVNEALHLSDKEDQMMEALLDNMEKEHLFSIDNYSQDIMVSSLDLLLSYSNRFYNRQFITRKTASNDILTRFESVLVEYFVSGKVRQFGLPTVQYLAESLNLSSNYLSDMLKNLTGQNTQQHIHNKLIEQAKDALTTTSLSVSEIAYQLGFEHPQSFNKLFKSKTNTSPLKFRMSFN